VKNVEQFLLTTRNPKRLYPSIAARRTGTEKNNQSKPDSDYAQACFDMNGLLEAIEHSLNYMAKPSSSAFYPYGDITHEHAIKSLQELKKLVTADCLPNR